MSGPADSEKPQGRKVSFKPVPDPVLSATPRTQIRFRPMTPNFVQTERSSSGDILGVAQSIVLSIVFYDGEKYSILGSAVMVGPGIALCAQHVIQHHLAALLGQRIEMVCIATTADTDGQQWQVTGWAFIVDHDLCILTLRAVSALPSNGDYLCAALTTRLPVVGDCMFITGFRPTQKIYEREVDGELVLVGNHVVCTGQVTQCFQRRRDSVLVRWPAIEVDCPAWGAMSGGAVFDNRGYLVGLISTSLETADEPSPMICALTWPVLGHPLNGGWPTNLAHKSLLELSGDGVFVERPDALTIKINPENGEVTTWHADWT